MIMCTSFAGPTAEQQAHDLVLELRQQFKLEAYSFRQTFDFTDPTRPTASAGTSSASGSGCGTCIRPSSRRSPCWWAILPRSKTRTLEKALDVIKHAKPDHAGREISRKVVAAVRRPADRSIARSRFRPENKQKGPMGAAFVTRNPLLPEEYFHSQGLDPFLVEINQDLEYSLLKCPGNYTVRVATFRGVDTMKPAEFERLTTAAQRDGQDRPGGDQGHRSCAPPCGPRGIEAYEFHDRTESIVTIGSFNDYGSPRADGKTEINPAMHQIMQKFGPRETRLANGDDRPARRGSSMASPSIRSPGPCKSRGNRSRLPTTSRSRCFAKQSIEA